MLCGQSRSVCLWQRGNEISHWQLLQRGTLSSHGQQTVLHKKPENLYFTASFLWLFSLLAAAGGVMSVYRLNFTNWDHSFSLSILRITSEAPCGSSKSDRHPVKEVLKRSFPRYIRKVEPTPYQNIFLITFQRVPFLSANIICASFCWAVTHSTREKGKV